MHQIQVLVVKSHSVDSNPGHDTCVLKGSGLLVIVKD